MPPLTGRPLFWLSLLCYVVGVLISTVNLSAQTATGMVVAEGGPNAIYGALVILEDEHGETVQAALTNESGRFVIRASGPGQYRLRAQRIGLSDGLTPIFELGVGQSVERTLALRERAIELTGIVVQARRRCTVRPESGLALAQLWEEARKALEVTAYTDAQQVYGYRIRRYTRVLDATSLRVVRESSTVHNTYGAESPYASRPVVELLNEGFIQERDQGLRFDAPDAHVLLSDDFANSYCLRIELPQPDTGELVGIAFEPVDRTGPAAIRGTLWLDRQSYELRSLDYRYTRSRLPFVEDPRVGGRVEFEAMADGTWIVRRWHIRVPANARSRTSGLVQRPSREVVLTEILEEGGEVLDTRVGNGTQQLAQLSVIEGVVFDSARAAPVADAFVYLSGTGYSATSDAAGRFSIEDVPEGDYDIGYIHPELQRLEYYPPLVPLSVGRGEQTRVDLGLPLTARSEAITRACSADPDHQGDYTGILRGRVSDERTGTDGAEATVEVNWTDVRGRPAGSSSDIVIGAGLNVARHAVVVQADDEGYFLACALPRTNPLHLQVRHTGLEGPLTSVDPLAGGTYTEIDLALPTSIREEANRASSSSQLTREQIGRYDSVYDAIQALRPAWLQRRSRARVVGNASPVWIYRDGTRLGEIDVLRGMSNGDVALIEYLDAATASLRWGPKHENGAIHLISLGSHMLPEDQ